MSDARSNISYEHLIVVLILVEHLIIERAIYEVKHIFTYRYNVVGQNNT